ncbi:MAG: nicotinate-nucleotide adenylyltransferase [bacterium]|nr:nicotinate-nucleotide adenylyltransferase [bacterium]
MAIRLGIFGGTFNPIHIGHLIIAQESLSQFALDKIIFIPAAIPPHKNLKGIASAEHRLQMTKLAISGNPQFVVSDLELKRRDTSYTIDTIRLLQKKYGNTAVLYFIIGMDALTEIYTWKKAEELLELCRFIVAPRTGFTFSSLDATIRRKIKILRLEPINISASEIRKRIKNGKPIRYFLPEKVYQYLRDSSVYGKNVG